MRNQTTATTPAICPRCNVRQTFAVFVRSADGLDLICPDCADREVDPLTQLYREEMAAAALELAE